MVIEYRRDLFDPPERDHAVAPPGVFDGHVHLFPDRLAHAIWRWFDAHAWSIRYRMSAAEIDGFLGDRGVAGYLALAYAHGPGIADSLNRFVLDFAAAHPRCVAAATVFPGEDDAEAILDRALSAGARAVKIHCHVQQVSPDAPAMDAIYRQVIAHDAVLLIHAGNEPAFPDYGVDVAALCRAEKFDRAMRRYPEMKVVVPHLGMGETAAYLALLDRYPNLYLDTAMALSGFFLAPLPADLLATHWRRLVYGSDFPNLPYGWDRDLSAVLSAELDPTARSAVLGDNLRRLLRVE